MPLLVLWALGSVYFLKQLDCLQEETEKLSDWLKQININIKAIKTSLPSSLADKEKSFKAMVDISQRMADGKHEILFELLAQERVPYSNLDSPGYNLDWPTAVAGEADSVNSVSASACHIGGPI